MPPADRDPPPRWLNTAEGWGMVVLMALGSVAMWIGIPLALLYVASRVADSSQPSLGPYLLVIIGLPLGMAMVGRLLGALDRRYAARLGEERRYRPAWTRSMRAERGSTHKWTVLDTVMMWSVLIAMAATAVWFFGFAGSSLPTP